MKVKRYDISEKMAKEAKNANSFGEYIQGSETAHYNKLVDSFELEVNKMLDKPAFAIKPEQEELIFYYANKYSEKLASAINRENEIRARVPSILIAGGSNFPVRKKEKQTEALEKHWKETESLYNATDNYYFNKIVNILTNKTIYSNDELVLEKLRIKLETLKNSHAEMKEANAYYRKHKTMKGYKNLSDEKALRIDEEIGKAFSWGKQPYPSYHLTNNNAEIHRIEKRIEEIEKIKANAGQSIDNKYIEVEGVEVVENADLMRIQLLFNGKPSDEIRQILKSNGFKWSPSNSAWQRQLNNNGEYATKRVLEKIKDL